MYTLQPKRKWTGTSLNQKHNTRGLRLLTGYNSSSPNTRTVTCEERHARGERRTHREKPPTLPSAHGVGSANPTKSLCASTVSASVHGSLQTQPLYTVTWLRGCVKLLSETQGSRDEREGERERKRVKRRQRERDKEKEREKLRDIMYIYIYIM